MSETRKPTTAELAQRVEDIERRLRAVVLIAVCAVIIAVSARGVHD